MSEHNDGEFIFMGTEYEWRLHKAVEAVLEELIVHLGFEMGEVEKIEGLSAVAKHVVAKTLETVYPIPEYKMTLRSGMTELSFGCDRDEVNAFLPFDIGEDDSVGSRWEGRSQGYWVEAIRVR